MAVARVCHYVGMDLFFRHLAGKTTRLQLRTIVSCFGGSLLG